VADQDDDIVPFVIVSADDFKQILESLRVVCELLSGAVDSMDDVVDENAGPALRLVKPDDSERGH
jgi:hypothetical protein